MLGSFVLSAKSMLCYRKHMFVSVWGLLPRTDTASALALLALCRSMHACSALALPALHRGRREHARVQPEMWYGSHGISYHLFLLVQVINNKGCRCSDCEAVGSSALELSLPQITHFSSLQDLALEAGRMSEQRL